MSSDKAIFRYSYGYVEDLGIRLDKKRNQLPSPQPPKVRSKHNRSFLNEEAPLRQLTSPGGCSSFPSPLYDCKLRSAYHTQLFEIREKLGEGSFGVVFQVLSKEDGHIYALKVAKEPFRNLAHRLQCLEEVKWQEELSIHKNILKLYNAWEEKNILFMQMEHCKMTLTHFAIIHQNCITESLVWDVMIDMLAALEFMHGKSLLHLDIKLDNILLGFDGLYKLGDFGLVHMLENSNIDPLEGDPKYVAPEIMDGKFTDVADIFSLGISLLELACNIALPTHGSKWYVLRQNRLPRTETQDLSEEFCNIISLFMRADYWDRPTAAQLLGHPGIEKWREARNKKLQLYQISRKINGAIRFLLSPIKTVYQCLVAVFSPLLPKNIPALCIDQAVNENNKTPSPSRNRRRFDFSPVMNFDENHFNQANRVPRRNLLSPTVRRNLSAAFSSDSEE